MTFLKIDKNLCIVDIDSRIPVKTIVGSLRKDGRLYKFTPERLSVGLHSVPKRLTVEEQIQVCFILDELNQGGKL